MDLSLDSAPLRNSDIAQYSWGRYAIRLGPGAAYENENFIIRMIAKISKGVGQWESNAEFAAFIAIAHEFVHYQQDVGTGCGHWDYLARTEFVSDVVREARTESWMVEPFLNLEPLVARRQLERYAAASLFNAYRYRDGDVRTLIRQELQSSPDYVEGAETSFLLPQLFELDAVLMVKTLIYQLNADEKSRSIAEENGHLFAPFKMPAAYHETYLELLSAFRMLLGFEVEPEEKQVATLMKVTDQCIPILLDIVFAHPPPSYFSGRRAGDRKYFEPGFRLIHVVRALQREQELEGTDAESSLEIVSRKTGVYEYPSLQLIYQAWAETFSPLAKEDAVAAWRLDQCDKRLKRPHALERRWLGSIVTHDLPAFIDSINWPSRRMLMTSTLLRDDGRLYNSILSKECHLSLTQWFLGGSPSGYVCPHAGEHSCPGSRPDCRTGTRQILDLPPIEQCGVRSMLSSAGFNFMELDIPKPGGKNDHQ